MKKEVHTRNTHAVQKQPPTYVIVRVAVQNTWLYIENQIQSTICAPTQPLCKAWLASGGGGWNGLHNLWLHKVVCV